MEKITARRTPVVSGLLDAVVVWVAVAVVVLGPIAVLVGSLFAGLVVDGVQGKVDEVQEAFRAEAAPPR